MPLTAPEPLADAHDLAEFYSGVPSLDDWLKRCARGNQANGATRTSVIAEGSRILAYDAVPMRLSPPAASVPEAR